MVLSFKHPPNPEIGILCGVVGMNQHPRKRRKKTEQLVTALVPTVPNTFSPQRQVIHKDSTTPKTHTAITTADSGQVIMYVYILLFYEVQIVPGIYFGNSGQKNGKLVSLS